MRTFVAGHEAVTAAEFAELALGTPLELWLGEDGESAEERAARLDAARDILADDPGLPDRAVRLAVETIAAHCPDVLNAVPLLRQPTRRHRQARKAVA